MVIHTKSDILGFFDKLNHAGIEYVLVKNIMNELPDKLPFEKDIDIMVKKCEAKAFHSLIREENGIGILHPYGPWMGYQTLYGTSYPTMYMLPSKLMIDVTDTLCVKCLNMKAWIPLDKSINSSIWLDKIWNENLRCWQMDGSNLICYLIARSIFDKHGFSTNYIKEIKQREFLLDNADVVKKMKSVFFDFTDNLIELIKNQQFDKILDSYIGYSDY